MNPLRRLKETFSTTDPGQTDPNTPGTPGTAGSSGLEEPGSSNQPLKWYKKVRRINSSKPGHPYELKAISLVGSSFVSFAYLSCRADSEDLSKLKGQRR